MYELCDSFVRRCFSQRDAFVMRALYALSSRKMLKKPKDFGFFDYSTVALLHQGAQRRQDALAQHSVPGAFDPLVELQFKGVGRVAGKKLFHLVG